ncbi:MAG: hypothetical protein NVSMB22_04670 [Chloroflexota bacterium]
MCVGLGGGGGAPAPPAPPTMQIGADGRGGNALPSVSRSVLYASSGEDYAEAAARAAREQADGTWLQLDAVNDDR